MYYSFFKKINDPMEKLYKIITLVLMVTITFGCAPKRQVQRVETDQTIDLSGRWNDSDSRSVSEEMIKQKTTY